MIAAGRLDRRVQLQQPTTVPGPLGQPVRGWNTVATYWMAIRPATGREVADADQPKGLLTHVVTMRHPGFTPALTWRLVYQSPTYNVIPRMLNIASVINSDERNRELVLGCTEVAAGSLPA